MVFRHMQRREESEPAKMALEMEVEGNKGRGRPSKSWMGCITVNMKLRELKEEDAENRKLWTRGLKRLTP